MAACFAGNTNVSDFGAVLLNSAVSALELADMCQYAIELVQRAVFQDQAAFAFGSVFNQHFGAQLFGQLVLQRANVGVYHLVFAWL